MNESGSGRPCRRDFLRSAALAGGAFVLGAEIAGGAACSGEGGRRSLQGAVPSYLRGFEDEYALDPRGAALGWFERARFGLFMHYGLYSQLGRGEWVMYNEKIPVAEYEKLKDTFNADRFDADFITDLALEAGMGYVNLTSRHHDGFCLFETSTSDYHSMNSPVKRDLVGELAEACQAKGLGLFLYYSYGADWRHPYFYPRSFSQIARPDYPEPEPSYLWEKDEDFGEYLDYAHGQIRELLTNYGPLAGIWFDPLMGFYGRPDLFPMRETYEMVRRLQPQTLISFKQGVTGSEDFAAPERSGRSLEDRIRQRHGDETAQIAATAWASNREKHNEICDTLQRQGWGYREGPDDSHKGPDEVMQMLAAAFDQDCNLLLNTGPLPDGSIHRKDAATLREVGRHIRESGWPLAT